MAKFLGTVGRASVSSMTNLWKVNLPHDLECSYLITPAHVAIYVNSGRWAFSHLLKDFNHLRWFVPRDYVDRPSPTADLAYARTDRDPEAPSLLDTSIGPCTPVSIYFRQPFEERMSPPSTPSMRSLDCILNPSALSSPNSSVLEGEIAVDKAIAYEHATQLQDSVVAGSLSLDRNTGDINAMLVRRGSLVYPKPRPTDITTPPPAVRPAKVREYLRSFLGLDEIKARLEYIERNMLTKDDVRREFGVATLFGGKHSNFKPNNSDDASSLPEVRPMATGFLRSMLGLDSDRQQLDHILCKVTSTEDNMPTKDDLHEVKVIFDDKRGIFLSTKAIIGLTQTPAVSAQGLRNVLAPPPEKI